MQRRFPRLSSPSGARAAFTLIELLVVLVIIGLVAAIALPKLQGIGKANATLSAERQMLDALAYARQLAIANRSDVYVVFVSPAAIQTIQSVGPATLDPVSQRVYTNLLSGQYTTYALLSTRKVGDQPGQSHTNYLSQWLSLPEGTFISPNKFVSTNQPPINITNLVFNNGNPQVGNIMHVYGFNVAYFPFPTAQGPGVLLPYVSFNSLGQMTSGHQNALYTDSVQEYIPLARGSVFYQRTANGQIDTMQPVDVRESPPGNSSDAYLHDVIMIDYLTGRAQAERTQLQ